MRRTTRTILAFVVVTAILSTEIASFARGRVVAWFLGASALSLWLHLAWREQMRRRLGPIDPTKEVA
jgi:hypothetical protein